MQDSHVIIKVIDDELLNPMVIEKFESINYKNLKEVYYESL